MKKNSLKSKPKTISDNVEDMKKIVRKILTKVENIHKIPDTTSRNLHGHIQVIMRTWDRIEEIANNLEKDVKSINKRLALLEKGNRNV